MSENGPPSPAPTSAFERLTAELRVQVYGHVLPQGLTITFIPPNTRFQQPDWKVVVRKMDSTAEFTPTVVPPDRGPGNRCVVLRLIAARAREVAKTQREALRQLGLSGQGLDLNLLRVSKAVGFEAKGTF
jgi:hypothetical protein